MVTHDVLAEASARWVLVLHTALGVAAVGAATHLVLWSRGFLRRSFGRLVQCAGSHGSCS